MDTTESTEPTVLNGTLDTSRENVSDGLTPGDAVAMQRYTRLAMVLVPIMCVFIVVGNYVVLDTLRRSRQQGTRISKCIVSLACADLIIGVSGPFTVLVNSDQQVSLLKSVPCILSALPMSVGIQASLGSLVLVTIDRYVCVRLPRKYTDVISHRRVTGAIASCWIISVLENVYLLENVTNLETVRSCMFRELLNKGGAVFICAITIGAMLLILLLNISMACIADRTQGDAADQFGTTATPPPPPTLDVRIHMIKAFAVIVTVFFIAYVPWSIEVVLHTFRANEDIYFANFLATMLYVNSAINPFIYGIVDEEFKVAWYKILRIRRNRVTSEEQARDHQGAPDQTDGDSTDERVSAIL